MKVGVTLLFISASFVMAVAYPVEKQTFDDHATEEAVRRGSCMTTAYFLHGGLWKRFQGCWSARQGKRCISGDLPSVPCFQRGTKCDTFYWYEYPHMRNWQVALCRLPDGQECYLPQNNLFDCSIIAKQEAALAEGKAADCECIKDEKGDEVCQPANCDPHQSSLKVQEQQNTAHVYEDDTTCVCIKHGLSGKEVCQPPNCDAGQEAKP